MLRAVFAKSGVRGARWLDGQPKGDDGSGYDSPPTRHAHLSSTSSGFSDSYGPAMGNIHVRGNRGKLGVVGVIAAMLVCLAVVPSLAAAKPVWLCRPGKEHNPCTTSLATTLLSPSGEQLEVKKVKALKHRKVDCFYVYPTVSDQTTPNANLRIDPEERSIALYQAARYSQQCRVFAPMYRQVTLSAISRRAVTTGCSGSPTAAPPGRGKTYLHKTTTGAAWS